MKVHSVHYSIGLAGKYKLHVGLRQQEKALPGSPFDLRVEPGAAFAASSKLPVESLPLQGIADEDKQEGLVFTTADVLGNACIKGTRTNGRHLFPISSTRSRACPSTHTLCSLSISSL